MERSGVKVDRDTLSGFEMLCAEDAGLEEWKFINSAGRKFNVGSPSKLGEIRLTRWALEGGKKARQVPMQLVRTVHRRSGTEHDLARTCWTGGNCRS